MSLNSITRCDAGGWLVPNSAPLVDHAWKQGEPVTGCSHLTCIRCNRRVLSFVDARLARRPEDNEWLGIYDRDGFGPFLGPPIAGHDFRLYICGCRARANGGRDTSDTLGEDDELPWACAGHPSEG